ncbi:hypothetical protein MAR_019493 [Mya arenaria]|uniref:Tesmin/TSO1-like CXC domain-containing protein n=1 Tax=Mya arenaria TaxID=6604 RepID=A0ABY7E4K8_MYAAR|nr:hypothetical protein MAR_019493 [Mya arenaria]
MLPYFAASGHNLYLKSTHIYLQSMLRLPETNPDVYEAFISGKHVIRRSDRYWAGLSTDLMNNAMQESYQTSEQHKDTSKSRTTRDSHDMTVMLSFLRDRNPFNANDTELRNMETGVVADKTVNADRTEAVGETILKEMTEKTAQKFSFKRSKQVVTMSDKSDMKRLTTGADRYVDSVSKVFRYELSSIPSSLFDNAGLPRVPQKATLADALWKQGECASSHDGNTHTSTIYVIDGGSLLQRLQWVKGYTFGELCESYSEYLRRHYRDTSVSIVFDGYEQGPITKDVTHFTHSISILPSYNFIFMLGESLIGEGYSVRHADNDADLMIVQTAVQNGINNYITFEPASEKATNMKGKIWDIRKATALFEKDLCTALPLLHALTGCDTTSRMFGIGKPAMLKLFKKSHLFRTRCFNFLTADSINDIHSTGEQLITCLYDNQSCLSLDALRFQKFSGKVVSSSTYVHMQELPPTSEADRFHCLRVYYQTKVWMGNTVLNPLDFGWIIVDGLMMPVRTSLPPVPENLLKIIRCNCKANCDSKKCTCRKHGLECSNACGDCKGLSCSNTFSLEVPEELVDDDV